jgi:hypothetical protein
MNTMVALRTVLGDLQRHPTSTRSRNAGKNALFARQAAAHVFGIVPG